MNNNHYQQQQQSQSDGGWATVSRWIVLGVLGYVAVTTTESKEGVKDLKRDGIEMKRDADLRDKKIQQIQDGMNKFATKDELISAEQRVRNEIQEQIRKAAIITGTDRGQHYEK